MEKTFSDFEQGDKTGQKIKLSGYKDTLVCISYDPFGFWRFSWEHGGELPEIISGSYTSWLEAKKALEQFISGKEDEERARERMAEAAQAKEDEINAQSEKAREEWAELQAAKAPAKKAPVKKAPLKESA